MPCAESRTARAGLTVTTCLALAALLCGPPPASAQPVPPLGVAYQFAVIGSSGVTGAAGAGVVVRGDVGSTPVPTLSNFPPSIVAPPFLLHLTNDAVVQQGHAGAHAAYDFMESQGPGVVLPDNLATVPALGPGVYSFVTGAANLPASTTLTLNGSGVFIFNVGSSLTANVLSNVVGTANPCNVFWRVGSSATLNGATFMGTVISAVSISVGAGANLIGRALSGAGGADAGSVTMSGSGGNTIGGCSAPVVVCPLITINPPTAPNGMVGTAYAQVLTATGGTGPYTFSLASGTLPAGMTLTAAGVLSGTPTTPGTSRVTIRVSDGNGCPAEVIYTIGITGASCPLITIVPPTLPDGMVGTAYSQTITASGGTAPYTFTLASGALPPGMTLTPAGVLAGTPTAPGAAALTIRVTDGVSCFAEVAYRLGVAAVGCPVITIAPATLPAGTLGVAYSETITASGGAGPYVFTVASGALPDGLTLSPAGVLSGTPTTLGSSAVVIAVTDGNNCPSTLPYTIQTISAVPTMPQLFVLLLALGLAAAGYVQLRRRIDVR